MAAVAAFGRQDQVPGLEHSCRWEKTLRSINVLFPFNPPVMEKIRLRERKGDVDIDYTFLPLPGRCIQGACNKRSDVTKGFPVMEESTLHSWVWGET